MQAPNKKIIGCFLGTRPEVIKMAPIITELKKIEEFETHVISTAQHRQMLDDMLKIFSITPDIDLDCMMHDQSLEELTANLFIKLSPLFQKIHFDAVLIQGDTTTDMVVALICFYRKIKLGHIEAGMRSFNLDHPFPEELNRVVISKLAAWHFAPTKIEKENLLHENISEEKIFVTGNTVIDAIKSVAKCDNKMSVEINPLHRFILVTAHRRENFGKPLLNICEAILQLVRKFKDVEIIYPVHPNPNVKKIIYQNLKNQERIHLIDPLNYQDFICLLKNCYFVITDSGGIQEEAPIFSKPVLIMRNTTERTLITSLGLGKLVGTDSKIIFEEASHLLTNANYYNQMAKHASPYGDGHSASLITSILKKQLDLSIKNSYVHS